MFRQLTRRIAAVGLAVATAVAGLPAAASAHGYRLGDISVGHVWAPPPTAGTDGVAVYGALLNGGARPVRLVGASSPIAGQARFRSEEGATVRWPAAIELLPGKPFSLAPWHAHIWLTGLRRPVSKGDSFDLTLDFGAAGHLRVEVVVEETPGH